MPIGMPDHLRIRSSVELIAVSVSSLHRPTSAQVMRPSGSTAVASTVSRAAPEMERGPRWIRGQSFMQPFSAEYWHIGAITIRFDNSSEPTRIGSKKVGRRFIAIFLGNGDYSDRTARR